MGIHLRGEVDWGEVADLIEESYRLIAPKSWSGRSIRQSAAYPVRSDRHVATVRYLVRDVDRAIRFYVDQLGFALETQVGSAFAMVRAPDELLLWLSGPQSSAARPMPDGRQPEPGGWNRIVVEVPDLEQRAEMLLAAGVAFRNAIVSGPGGKQILVEDPEGNIIELFEPR